MSYKEIAKKIAQVAWHETCYLYTGLNPTFTSRFGGPDAIKMLKKYCANSFEKFPVGKGKHALFLNKYGKIMAHGVLIRTAEEEFYSYWLDPYLAYCIDTCGMDVWQENLTEKVCMYQLGGPNSLQIVEAAAGMNFHDLPFMGHCMTKIAGKDCRIIRMGMAGSLAYEVHAAIEDGIAIYNQLVKAGKKYGLVRLGFSAYVEAHWENGFTQSGMDFPLAYNQDENFVKYLTKDMDEKTMPRDFVASLSGTMKGSSGPELEKHYRYPIACGWGKTVAYDHDFVGREALEKIRDGRHFVPVTLEWNVEDILDVFRSQFTPEEERYQDMSLPDDFSYDPTNPTVSSIVLNRDGEWIGDTTGRMVSWFYQRMISVGFLYEDEAIMGNEVTVIWGDPGIRQKHIRATIARWPYMNTKRNQKVDVSLIPVGTMD